MSKQTKQMEIRETLRLYQRSSNAGYSSNVEINTSPSKTVPDESFTVREILERFTRGILPPISKDLIFTDDLEDLRGLEPWQITELIAENKDEIRRLERLRNLELLPPKDDEKPEGPEIKPDDVEPKED